MTPVKVSNLNKWNRPPTAIYENNYGYGINFYQPMIDYISAKEHGVAVKPPKLPYNNERGLEKYRFDKPIKTYSEADLTRISREVAERAKKDLNTFNVTKRSPFSVVATAAATNVTKHVAVESIAMKTKKKKNEKILEKQRVYGFDNALTYNKSSGASAIEAKLKDETKIYKGKSAKAIAKTLLSQNINNVSEVRFWNIDGPIKKIDDDYTYTKQPKRSTDYNEELLRASKRIEVRERSPKVCVVKIETDISPLSDSYRQQLNELKETINLFENINTSFLIDSR